MFLRCLKEDNASILQTEATEVRNLVWTGRQREIAQVPLCLPKSNTSEIPKSLSGFSWATHFVAHFPLLHKFKAPQCFHNSLLGFEWGTWRVPKLCKQRLHRSHRSEKLACGWLPEDGWPHSCEWDTLVLFSLALSLIWSRGRVWQSLWLSSRNSLR